MSRFLTHHVNSPLTRLPPKLALSPPRQFAFHQPPPRYDSKRALRPQP